MICNGELHLLKFSPLYSCETSKSLEIECLDTSALYGWEGNTACTAINNLKHYPIREQLSAAGKPHTGRKNCVLPICQTVHTNLGY